MKKIYDNMRNVEELADHFNKQAEQYENEIANIIPDYNVMLSLVAQELAAKPSVASILDLGCGTGALSKKLLEKLPSAKLTCVDLSEEMIAIAKQNLPKETEFIVSSFESLESGKKFDAIVSSFALHHIKTDDEKLAFYKKIFSWLNPKGIFLNLDLILGDGKRASEANMKYWVDYMEKTVGKEEAQNRWVKAHELDDCPISMKKHFMLLSDCGFSSISQKYLNHNFAIFCAIK